ncbi:MAG: hypothetical protein LBL43_02520, partial [Treponema sp.]|nr:hypothetical protein [Treponema sp.]
DPAETVAAVPRAASPRKEQNPVGVLLNQPGRPAVSGLSQRVIQGEGVFFQFPGIGDKLLS